MLAIGLVVLIALDIPAKAERAAGTAVGEAGFTVSGYQIVGIRHMDRIAGRRRRHGRAAPRRRRRRVSDKAPQALVDVASIRERLLQFGWVKDARFHAGFPTRSSSTSSSAARAPFGRTRGQLALIDGEGVVLDRVPVDKMPDLPLLIGPGANARKRELSNG